MTRSIFSRLRKLFRSEDFPTEDFLTEIIRPKGSARFHPTALVEFATFLETRRKDQVEFLDFVSDLLNEYESQGVKPDVPTDPVEVLQDLVKENGITTRELGKISGVDHSIAARILKGERGITVEHAKNLGARFKVDPQLFLNL